MDESEASRAVTVLFAAITQLFVTVPPAFDAVRAALHHPAFGGPGDPNAERPFRLVVYDAWLRVGDVLMSACAIYYALLGVAEHASPEAKNVIMSIFIMGCMLLSIFLARRLAHY